MDDTTPLLVLTLDIRDNGNYEDAFFDHQHDCMIVSRLAGVFASAEALQEALKRAQRESIIRATVTEVQLDHLLYGEWLPKDRSA